jgi:hypothetical protein
MKVRMRICFFCIGVLLVAVGLLCVYGVRQSAHSSNIAADFTTAPSQEGTSEEELTVQETAAVANGYYLVMEDGILMVYQSDKKTLYLKTDITQDEVLEENQEILQTGLFLENQKELYDYLESCTS